MEAKSGIFWPKVVVVNQTYQTCTQNYHFFDVAPDIENNSKIGIYRCDKVKTLVYIIVFHQYDKSQIIAVILW